MAIKEEKIREESLSKPESRLANAGSLLGFKKEEQNTLVKPSSWFKKEDYSMNNLIDALRNKVIVELAFVQMKLYARY